MAPTTNFGARLIPLIRCAMPEEVMVRGAPSLSRAPSRVFLRSDPGPDSGRIFDSDER